MQRNYGREETYLCIISECDVAGWDGENNCGVWGEIGMVNVAVPLLSFVRMNDCRDAATFVISGLCRKYLGMGLLLNFE